ncbi:hypothetical protein GW17_00048257 [Ensete ventricosum]|nr:hypothetical protein GW17_00048257 [Ensete ventricosum]
MGNCSWLSPLQGQSIATRHLTRVAAHSQGRQQGWPPTAKPLVGAVACGKPLAGTALMEEADLQGNHLRAKAPPSEEAPDRRGDRRQHITMSPT